MKSIILAEFYLFLNINKNIFWKQAQYNLKNATKGVMPPAGVEPATLGLLDPRSNRLSYGGLVGGTPD
uniref:Uncharacterized protein n=1 Tax=Strongyloides venezuelensis TaxID=75913 RepID=A0A0K0FBX8_STRVS